MRLKVIWLSALIALITFASCALAQSDQQTQIRNRIRERMKQRRQEGTRQTAVNYSGDPSYSLEFEGLKRSYLLHLPKNYDGKTSLPLVVVFHGGGGAAQGAVRMTGMDGKADAENFIAVYPNGTGPLERVLLTWNAWNCCGSALDNHVDDAGFVRALVEKLERNYNVDRNRIYATGISNGGMMSYKVGCELSDIFAAIAPVAGALNTDEFKPAQPVSVIAFHGMEDKHVLYNGGAPQETIDRRHHRVDKPVSYAVACWVKQDRCNPTPSRTKAGHVIHDVYSGGVNGTAVELYTIENQGHAWPGGLPGLRNGNVDPPSGEISATDVMWTFFKKHPKTVVR